LTLRPGNLLVLDEPTNHLDIGSREALEATLKDYPGSILFVSHDRQFIDALADKLWIVQDGKLTEHLGNYSDYAARLAAQRSARQEAERKQQNSGSGRATGGGGSYKEKPSQEDRQRKKRLATLEAEVAKLEQELARIQSKLEAASQAQDVEQVAALGQQYTEAEAQLERCYADWEQLAA
jgi:ATP-binding cassette subfamily F protein 3